MRTIVSASSPPGGCRFARAGITACLAILLVGALGGCGGNDGQVSYKSGGVTQTFIDGAAAKSFPLPLYPNASPAGAVAAQDGNDGDDSHFMMLSSSDPPEKIQAFYMEKLKADGWTVAANSFAPQLSKLDAHKQGLEASVMLAVDNNKTTITLTVSKEDNGTPTRVWQPFTLNKMNPPTD